MDFWRGEAYQAFFNYLDAQGGFYYEVGLLSLTLSLFYLHAKILIKCFVYTALGRRACALDRRRPLCA